LKIRLEVSDALTRGVYAFDNLHALLLGTTSTPDGFAAVQPGQDGYRGFRQSFFGLYGQDDFKVSQRLTLNLGLRWEASTDPKDVNGRMSNLLNLRDPITGAPVAYCGSNPTPGCGPTILKGSYFGVTKKDFQPRIGLAWQLSESGTTVLRAGFGIYHDHVLPYSYANFVSRQPPFYNSFSSGNVVPQFPNGYLNLTVGAVPSLTPFPSVIKEPTKNSYNVSLQRQFVKDMLLEVAYLGSQSHHLQGSGEQNTPVPTFVNGQPTFAASGPQVRANPNFSSVRYYRFDTNASYNAFQATLKRRSASGLQYQASYTFSKSLDLKSILTNGDTRQEPGVFMDPLNPGRDRGLSTFNAKHNFIVTTTYPFPFRFQQKAAQLALGGWTINGIGTLRSGQPFTVRTGFNRARNGDTQTPDRPDLRPGFSNSPTSGTSAGCLNSDGSVAVAPGTKLGTIQFGLKVIF
jgi:TonB dependent receptor